MTYAEFKKTWTKVYGSPASKEMVYNRARELALQDAADAIGIRLDTLEALIKAHKKPR